MSEQADTGQTRTAIALVLMAIFAGGNTVAVRFSNSGLPPFWGAVLRFAAAGVVFWLIVAVRRIALPTGRALVGVLVFGLISNGLAYAFLYWGLLRAPASLAGAALALVPLLTLMFAWAHRVESFRWRGLIGALIATVGIFLGVIRGFGDALHIPSALALVLGAACIAEGTVVRKLFPRTDPVATNAIALTAGTPLLFLLSVVFGEAWILPRRTNTWVAFVYLVLIGSVVVFNLYLYVLERWTASATSYAFLLMPVATVILAALIAGETITVPFLIGGALVLVGVWIGTIHESRETAELTCAEMPNKALCG